MRTTLSLMILGAMCSSPSQALAQPGDAFPAPPEGRYDRRAAEDPQERELRHERYETELARERAEQAYLEHQASMYDYQRRQQEVVLERMEQERRSSGRSSEISNINQAANSIANIAWQAELLGRGGW